jgi:hypothetical protein
MTRILLLISTIIVTACATPLNPNQVSVEFDTEPPLAVLYGSDGTAWGTAPKTRVWTFNTAESARIGSTVSITAI